MLQANLEEQSVESARLTEVIRQRLADVIVPADDARLFTCSHDVPRKRGFLYTSRPMCKLFGRMLIDTPAPC